MSEPTDEPFGDILAVIQAEMAAAERDATWRAIIYGDQADRIRMHSSDRGEPPRPPRIDTRWHPDGCTCHACRAPRVSIVTSTRDASRPSGAAPPFRWARGA